MTTDPILTLAFSIHANKGAYALLLGSGISRSAGIPTGWEVVEHLIRQIAHLKAEDPGPDPEIWYNKAFGKDAEYTKLLGMVGKSPAERSRKLRSYFEPSEEEREQNLKAPTEAHKAIAELVAKGYIRVIITTNFDRLLEQALQELGIVPTVISTPQAIDANFSFVHIDCYIVKVHGDYVEANLKNTVEELAEYDPRMNELLKRIFDEFGLIVCGWSAEWG